MDIHQRVRNIIWEMQRNFREPVGIVFNRQGYMEAMRSRDVYQTFGIFNPSGKLTYFNLPYRVEPSQTEEVQVIDHLGSLGAIQVSLALPAIAPDANEAPILCTVIGAALSQHQLCNIVQAYTKAHKGEPLSIALLDAVERYGSFER